MSNKIDTTISLRDRQESRSESATSNATYVKDLKSSNSMKPPKKLFKEDSDYIRRSTTTPQKNEKVKTTADSAELEILKEKYKENAAGEKTPGQEQKKKQLTSEISSKISVNADEVTSLLENSKLDDQGPQIEMYDAMERYELAQRKYLEIKDHLPEKIQNKLEVQLEKMRKKIEELLRKVSSSSTAGAVLRPVENEEGEGDDSILGNIAEKIGQLSDLGIPIIPGKRDDNKEEDTPN